VAYKGNSFYYFYEGNNGTGFYCGLLDKPLMKYPTPRKLDGLPFKIKSGAEGTWKYYAYNLNKTEKMLAMLSNGMKEPIENLKAKLDAKFPIEKANSKMLGARYWCWNYIVEKLIVRLENDKLIERDNSDVFMMQETEY